MISAGVCQHLGDNISQTLQSALLIPPSCARSHFTCLSLVLHNRCIVPDFSISVTAPLLPASTLPTLQLSKPQMSWNGGHLVTGQHRQHLGLQGLLGVHLWGAFFTFCGCFETCPCQELLFPNLHPSKGPCVCDMFGSSKNWVHLQMAGVTQWLVGELGSYRVRNESESGKFFFGLLQFRKLVKTSAGFSQGCRSPP